MYLVLLFLFIILILFLYIYNYVQLSYWEKRGVFGPKPRFLVGNIGESLIGRKTVGEVITDIYNKYEDLPFIGIYRAVNPSLLIRDPEFIKNVTVRDFSYFTDNEMDVDKKVDPLLGRNPFFLKGEEWKATRSFLTPCFTSGKMKSIFPLIEEISKKMIRYIDGELDAHKETGFEMKEICSKFTIDNVASCAFGLDGKCFEEENSEFNILAKRFLSPGGFTSIKFILFMMFPFLSKIMTIKLVDSKVENQLLDIISSTLKYRKANNIVRNDFLDIVGIPKNDTPSKLSDLEVTAHCASFFADGYETSSIVMSFILFSLASNPHIQETLREEIIETINKHKGQITYEGIHEMSYMDAVICESQRMYPIIMFLGKVCTKEYTYSSSGKTVTLKPDTTIILPLQGLCRDKKYFDNPDVFDPTRFLGENKINESKYIHMPFGEGQRSCLGKRFALMQIKVGVVQLIRNYELRVNKKTRLPLKYDPFYFMISPIGGLWVDFHKINKE